MDRTIVYPLAVPLETDMLNINVDTMKAIGGVLQMLVGGQTCVVGLACTPIIPAGLGVTIAPGSITEAEEVDPVNAYSTLGTNTLACMKMGLSSAPVNLTLAAPTTAGYSQIYLVQVQFSETDGVPVTLPYLNAANINQALAGPGGDGATQNTRRLQTATLSLVAGTPATTGTQTAPAAAAGCFPLYYVTVANGQTVIVSSNISIASGAPFIAATLQAVAYGAALWSDSGATNALAIALTPVPASLATLTGASLKVKVLAANTGAATINVNGLGATAIQNADGSALAANQLIAGGVCTLVYNGTAFVLQSQTVSPAFLSGIAGTSRNLAAYVSAASASGTWTADEVVVASALGGLSWKLGNFSETVNLSTTGAGGMDTGSAPNSGFVAIYAIYNPGTGATALLATNATSTLAPGAYGGGNMPAGYTASALISVWSTSSTGFLNIGHQTDRDIKFPNKSALSTATQVASGAVPATLSISSSVPLNAKRCSGNIGTVSTTAAGLTAQVYSTAVASSQGIGGTTQGAQDTTLSNNTFENLHLVVAQTIYYVANVSTGTMSFTINIFGYTI